MSPEVRKRLVAIFQRLANEKLLKRCQRIRTQNPNESLHQLIWKLAPKTVHASRNTLETAVDLALCQFSMGNWFRHMLCQIAGFDARIFLQLGSMKAKKRGLKTAKTASPYITMHRRKQLKLKQKTGIERGQKIKKIDQLRTLYCRKKRKN